MSAKPRWLDTARRYIGVRETSPNCSPEIRRFLQSVNLPCGYAWCAAFVRYCLDAGKASQPSVRSAAAQKYVTRDAIPAKHVLKGYRTVKAGWLAVWTHSQSWTGHIGFVERQQGDVVTTIEGNTGNDLRDGDGVYRKQRRIVESTQRFQLRWFVPVR